ncbi:phosphotransferase enzyme family protein [Streptomyces sp. TLI_171]|uniref:phosphotransferase enzyme family protein n=1 Tax=Streptomyces sp. TLI_171 TaxID=1938859 RepID=UPI000C6AA64F|nr:aminoglycoside phosphotransferase family protein [Streptomyces sp. TLI_171]RKE18541.1 Ser/Thr protein kinase RdoA (MazF antagonist) [Streptomyces sp. TLI_171]
MIFDEPRARALLQEACAPAGIDPAGAALLALGQNAVFDLPAESLVAKVGRSPDAAGRAGRELALAAWLDGAGVPVVRPADPAVRLVQGHPVTLWHRLPAAVRPARPVDLAPLLTALHALPAAPVPLGGRDLLAPVDSWLAAAEGHVDPADAAFLRARKETFVTAAGELTPFLPPGPIHGDALPRNVHITPDGPVLLDLEYMAADLREHDLVVLALSQDRYGVPAQEVAAFNSAYGWDVRDWPGFAVLRGARETASAAWVAQQTPGNPSAQAEFRRRVDSLRDGEAAVRWFAF